MPEHVILFTGPMGAGKTTAIRSLSEIEVVLTEAENSDRETVDKPTTTVALDYGEITIGGDEKVRLYGIPGQKRFDFMWEILKERAKGMVLLINNDAPEPLTELREFLDYFGDLYARGGIVVAVTRSDVARKPQLAEYSAAIAALRPDLIIPVFSVDARSTDQMRTTLMTLILNVETRAAIGGAER
ncbi:MAG: GTP-binding protein [Rhodoglobus sp.]